MSRVTGITRLAAAMCAVVALLAGNLEATQAAAAAESAPRVTVTYVNPQNFSEAREFGQQDRFRSVDYLGSLQTHLIKRATRMLPPDQRLEVTVTDIKLAGSYEPWRGPRMNDVRIMKDVYPPRIDLTFKLTGADGAVLREGSRTLRNLGYLHSGLANRGDTDPLRYDKTLLDDWLRRGPDAL